MPAKTINPSLRFFHYKQCNNHNQCLGDCTIMHCALFKMEENISKKPQRGFTITLVVLVAIGYFNDIIEFVKFLASLFTG